MKFFLTGVETTNKGAELMLYAILQEIERKYPHSIVYIPSANIPQGVNYVNTRVRLKILPFDKLTSVLKLEKIFRLLHFPISFLPNTFAIRNADYYFDGSGFAYSDQFDFSHKSINFFSERLKFLYRHGCKIVFLPQAFGPIRKDTTKDVMSVISKYSTLVMPREKVSYNAIDESRLVDMEKVRVFTDFTSLVEGEVPRGFEHLKNGICVIPNTQMINKGAISIDSYIRLLNRIINACRQFDRSVYLLNHEGSKDDLLCNRIKDSIGGNIDVVRGLNALEIKGLISTAYLVISSRFHGVASSLNNCVPCVATSWSHKYKELYNDYDMEGCILPLDNEEKALSAIVTALQEENNAAMRATLRRRVPEIQDETRKMWETIWNI